MIETNKFTLILILSLLFSSITLYYLEFDAKYLLFVITVGLLITTITSFMENKESTLIIKKTREKESIISYSLILCVVCLTAFNLFDLTDNYFSVFFSIVVVGYLPGWVLLTLLSKKSFSITELLVLPFVLSIPISAVLSFVYLLLPGINPLYFLALYSIFSLFLLLQIILKKEPCVGVEKVKLQFTYSHGILIILGLLFLTTIILLYPRMSLVPGLDIVHHFSLLKQLLFDTSAYKGPELWFNLQQASIYLLSNSSIQVFQTVSAVTSILSIIAFYLMSKTYLKDIDSRLPAISTLFWGAFSGFGWIYLLLSDTISSSSTLSSLSSHSFFDAGYGQGLIWFWYRPLTLGLTLLFTLLYLLRENTMGKKPLILIIALVSVTLSFVHFPELIIFALFAFFLAILRKSELRLFETTLAIIIGMLVSLLLTLVYGAIFTVPLAAPRIDQCLIVLVIGSFAFFILRIDRRASINKSKLSFQLILAFVAIVYVWLFAVWLLTVKNFSLDSVAIVWAVPWQFYPILLGFSGLLSLVAVKVIWKHFPHHPVVIFVLLLIFAISFGRLLTFVNVNIGILEYWERRIIPIAYAAACMLAPIALIGLFSYQTRKRRMLSVVAVCSLVTLGLTSTFLSIEFQADVVRNNSLTNDDIQILNDLNRLPPDKVLLTAPGSSLFYIDMPFTQYKWLIDYYRYQLWSATSPELPLNVLYSLDKPAYLLLNNIDFEKVNSQYASSYLVNGAMPHLQFAQLNNETSIAPLPKLSAPMPNSDTVLVISNTSDPLNWLAYNLLSSSRYEYSTSLLNDISTLSSVHTMIAPSEDIALKILKYKETYDLQFNKLIILNWSGYKGLAPNYFDVKNELSIDNSSLDAAAFILNGSKYSNLPLFNDDTFEVQADYNSSNFIPLISDNLGAWSSSVSGSGNISDPILTINSNSNNTAIEVNIGKGDFSYWKIGKDFENLSASDSDFLSFYWYGQDSGKSFVVQCYSGSSGNYWFNFNDSWQGWKKVMIPLRIQDGSFDLNGVKFGKATTGNPSWDRITKIEIKNEATNPNANGVLLIKNLGFESAKIVSFTANSIKALELMNYDQTGLIKKWLIGTENAELSDYMLSNGMSAKEIFGDRSYLRISFNKSEFNTALTISVRIPCFPDNSNLNKIMLQLKSANDTIELYNIVSAKGLNLLLNTPINASILTSNKNVLAYYCGLNSKLPFVIADKLGNVESIYVNVFPLLASDSLRNNYSVLGYLPDLMPTNSLSEAHHPSVNPVEGQVAAFNSGDLEGAIYVVSDGSAIISGANLAFIYDGSEVRNVTNIVFTRSAALQMNNCRIIGGGGFYSNLLADSILAKSDSSIGKVTLFLENGGIRIIDVTLSEVYIKGDLSVMLKSPIIKLSGNVTLHNLYAYADLSKLGILGVDAYFEGNLSLKVAYGDTFLVTNAFAYNGELSFNHAHYYYDELYVIASSYPIIIIVSIGCIGYYLYIKRTRNLLIRKGKRGDPRP